MLKKLIKAQNITLTEELVKSMCEKVEDSKEVEFDNDNSELGLQPQ